MPVGARCIYNLPMETHIDAYVTQADGIRIGVKLLNDRLQSALQALGFTADEGGTLTLPVTDDAAKATAFIRLRDLGVAFSAGREWCPADVFEHFRDGGLLQGSYLRVVWRMPQQFIVTTE
ncbi:hypothetical protein [Stenotrophomonas lactitubi]|uniref:hypothetical protein n=2 Tax=Stenotrophomonas lactitubi TaxID=2045214 RepID=UPI001D1C6835|nr:hypothetical protein [Stenotrophomonas lactitubi]CAH0250723.1 hypothetical protein SRABI102_03019 [Stenotrophomonas lactitubi]CAH0255551.1 hypothetical protein SRABI81_03306 [Stenotrophomonas lactitubi]CAH0267725.1 hypothetical protein SRABI122_03567 [Stenotrophomonas lactitubi]CAH0269564.1 hypothetical protein SRABI66_03691 [Stenotrophomonas lactitubi]